MGKARILAFGDIHGCRRPLQALLGQVRPTPADTLVFLGDYIDRGADSAGVITDLLELRERFPKSLFLRGNHEQMLLDLLDGDSPLPFLGNGGDRTIASYEARGAWPPPAGHLDFFRQLLPLHESEAFIFTHAGLRPGRSVAEQVSDDLLWIRAEFLDSEYDWGKPVVFGHTPLQAPLLTATRIGLDTGCVYGGKLTCCELLTRQFWQSS